MEIRSFILLGIILVVIIGAIAGTMVFLLGKAFDVFNSSVEFSPLEGDVKVDNTEYCSDSDGGIFFEDKGEINLKRSFLFWDWGVKLEDKCEDKILTEYYCVNSKERYGKGELECEVGCFNGGCF
jgi:hypothetical protein